MREIYEALWAAGLRPDEIVTGELRRCTAEGDRGGRKSGSYLFFNDTNPICSWWNWRTGEKGSWRGEATYTSSEREQNTQRVKAATAVREKQRQDRWQRNRQSLLHMWQYAGVLTADCPAGIYLTRRGLSLPNTQALRFSPSLAYWQDGQQYGEFPALLAAVSCSAGSLVAIHRTYLTDEGCKANVSTVKKLTSTAGSLQGTSIKLGTPVRRTCGQLALGIAEGVETAIAASMLSGLPVWSCVSAYGLAAFVPPPEVGLLYVFADNDSNEIGQKAAYEIGERAAHEGMTVRILIPPSVGDWNDDLCARRQRV